MANKTMTNLEIYAYADALMNAFKEEITLPATKYLKHPLFPDTQNEC